MAWIESHDALGAHPKTRKLARLLDVSRVTAVGHLQFFWWWAMSCSPDGDLSKHDDLDIAIGAEWESRPAEFIDAMVSAGFIDRGGSGKLSIHDWDQYGGRLIRLREASTERAIAYRIREAIIERDGMTCGICGRPILSIKDIDIDHIQPISKGGKSVLGNLRVAHARCNRSRGNH